jgi:branched-chain amino acid transport system permease protein
MLFGNEVRPIELGIVDEPIESILTRFNIVVSKFDLAAGSRRCWWPAGAVLPVHQVGRAARGGGRPPGRAVDRHSAAEHLGHRLGRGRFVALVAGMMWGSRNGVQFALTLTALKALPVLILGGFTSVPGAIVGGLIIGARRSWPRSTSRRSSSLFGGNFGGIEGWFPMCWRCCSCWSARRAVRREAHRPRLTESRHALS